MPSLKRSSLKRSSRKRSIRTSHNSSREWRWNWPAARQVFAGGAAGAAIVAIVLFGLWLSGFVPSRYAETTGADPAVVAALNQRVARLEATIVKLPANDKAISERATAADNAMKSLGIALAALEQTQRRGGSDSRRCACPRRCVGQGGNRIAQRHAESDTQHARPDCLRLTSIPCKNVLPRWKRRPRAVRQIVPRGWR